MGRMWIPRLSLLTILGLFTGLGVFLAVVALAVRGNEAAMAVSVAIGSLALAVFVYALFFLVALLLATLLRVGRGRPQPTSPFANESPPPQIIAPEETT
jgi:hypothetical protein